MDIQPVTRTRAHEEVARQLRAMMERGELRAGDRLPAERELAKRFQVSRVTIRQALTALQGAGLIESRVGDGTFARSGPAAASVTELAAALRLAQGTLREQLELRRVIEPQVARLAAEHAEDAGVAELRRHLAAQRASLDRGVPFVDEDGAFHLSIAQATNNALLAKMVEGIHELLRDSREHSLHASGGMQRSFAGHRRILDAIARRDVDAAGEAMLDHIVDVERLSLQDLRQHPLT